MREYEKTRFTWHLFTQGGYKTPLGVLSRAIEMRSKKKLDEKRKKIT